MNKFCQILSRWMRPCRLKSDPLATAVPDSLMRSHRSPALTLLLLLIISLMTALMPTYASAGLDSLEALTAWAEGKAWLWDPANRGYRSDENNSFDIYIKYDRRPTLTPFDRSWTSIGKVSYTVTESGKNITLANGIPATVLYTSIVYDDGSRDFEKWEYYCHDYRVLMRAHREANSGQVGSDPQALLEDYIAFADIYLKKGPVDPASPKVADKPNPITNKPSSWKLDDKQTHALLMTVEYMKKRADELSRTDKDMADLLRLYADRILAANISYKEKPLLGSGEASCSWLGNITIYNKMTSYQPFSKTKGPFESYGESELGVVASLLMHEVAHSKGANEWQAHLLQKLTFDALKVGEDRLPDGTLVEVGTKRHNQQYFDTYKSAYDPRAQFFYTAWIKQGSKGQKTPLKFYTGGGYGNQPKN